LARDDSLFRSGVWEPVPDNQQLRDIAAFAGAPVADGKTVRALRLSARGCKGVLELAQARLSKPGLFHDAKCGLAFANGFVMLEGKRAVQRDASPEHRARLAYSFTYTPEAPSPRWKSFLESLWEGDDDRAEKVAALQEFVG
jgi:hypothetical protein